MKRLSYKNFTQSIRHHLGNVHVGTPDEQVEQEIREAISKFRTKNPATAALLTKQTEDACVRYAFKCHRENQRLYAHVMRGRL